MRTPGFLLALALAVCLGAACVPSNRTAGTEPSGFSAPFAVALPDFATPVTREEIHDAYVQYGSTAIVRKLHTENAANWNMVMNKIAAGDAAWIECAAEYIMPGADAGASEDIMISLAYGLQNNPRAVLIMSQGQGIPVDSICTLPFIEPDAGFVESYGKKTVAALGKVNEPRLAGSRNECLRLLRDSLARAAQEYTAGR